MRGVISLAITNSFIILTFADYMLTTVNTNVNTIMSLTLVILSFPHFDLAPKRNEKFVYCGLDLV